MAKGALFKTLAKAFVSKQRSVIISKHMANSGFTVGQQVEVQEGTKVVNMFIKGAFHIDSIEGLYNLRDALNEAIKKVEDEEEAKNAENFRIKAENYNKNQ